MTAALILSAVLSGGPRFCPGDGAPYFGCPELIGPSQILVGETVSPVGLEKWRWPMILLGWPPETADDGLRVMACESGGNHLAKNPSSSAAGLFQFLRSTWNWVRHDVFPDAPTYEEGGAYNPGWAITFTIWLSRGGSWWSHWVCKP